MKRKFNNKGFAISSIIYAMLLLFLTLLVLIVTMLTRRKIVYNKTKSDVLNVLNYKNRTVSYNKSDIGQTFVAPLDGYYKVELWGGVNRECSSDVRCLGSYSQFTIRLNQSDNLMLFVDQDNSGRTILYDENAQMLMFASRKSENDDLSELISKIYAFKECKYDLSGTVCESKNESYGKEIIEKSIILAGENSGIPNFSGSDLMNGNSTDAHAKITFVSATRPINSVDLQMIGNGLCGNPSSVTLNDNNLAIINNGYDIRIDLPDKKYSFEWVTQANSKIEFCELNNQCVDIALANTSGKYISNNIGYLKISGGSANINNFNFNGQSVDSINYNNAESLPLSSLNVDYYINCLESDITDSGIPGKCRLIKYGYEYDAGSNSDVIAVVTNNVTSDLNYKNQIKINNNDWADMTNTSGKKFSYKKISGSNLYRVKTRQVYNNNCITSQGYISKETKEYMFTIR